MNYLRSIIFTLLLLVCSSSLMAQANLSPYLNSLQNQPDSQVNVVVLIENIQSEDKIFKVSQSKDMKRSQRIKSVINNLQSFSSPQKSEIEAFLQAHSSTELVKHWIIPAYTATLNSADLAQLSVMPGVKLVFENVNLTYESPVDKSPAPMSASASISDELNLLNVPALWQRGLKGNGRLICSFDTGVDYDHPALYGKWRGVNHSLAESWFSRISPGTMPLDATGHGTHTMGIMVGALEADSFGVAPEAKWISAGVIDQGQALSLTISDILAAFEWALNPDGDINTTDDVPDVILNSWGIPRGLFVPCEDRFWGVIDNVEAAGIVTVFAAGNEGPDRKSLRDPADRATTAVNAFAVGAVSINKNIATFSSRGPSSCDTTQVKPEVVAPGVSVRSCANGGGFTYMSGTSMAAPYIAASVALIRQYNPEATVEEIKYAFLQAADDLGTPGNDNDYGHGLVNMARVLDYIPSPVDPEVEIVSTNVGQSEYAMPGETFDLMITLNNAPGNLEIINGTITALQNNYVTLENDAATFYFGLGNTYAINTTPITIRFDSSLYHGQVVDFSLVVNTTDYGYVDTLSFSMSVGLNPIGSIVDMANSRLGLTVSDFGQFGFAPGSIFNLNQNGLNIDFGQNVLYEAGMVIGRNSLQLSSSLRDLDGKVKLSDFVPKEELSEVTLDAENNIITTATINDSRSLVPIPIDIKQKIIMNNNPNYERYIIFDYKVYNASPESITNLYFGFLADFDLSDNDHYAYKSELALSYLYSDDGKFIGLVDLKNIDRFSALANGEVKTGYNKIELYSMMSADGQTDTLDGDMMNYIGTSSFSLAPHQEYQAAFALVVGNSEAELLENAALAKSRFDIITSVNDDLTNLLPEQFELFQNYPNPFNPETNISFALDNGADCQLDIFNINGQRVMTIHSGYLEAGVHEFAWNATNQSGAKVASGVYLYRLTAGANSQVKKMVLLK